MITISAKRDIYFKLISLFFNFPFLFSLSIFTYVFFYFSETILLVGNFSSVKITPCLKLSKFSTILSNKMLLNAAKGKPTGRLPPAPHPG